MIGTIIAKNRCAKRSHGTPDITKHKHLATNSEKILISVSVKEDRSDTDSSSSSSSVTDFSSIKWWVITVPTSEGWHEN